MAVQVITHVASNSTRSAGSTSAAVTLPAGWAENTYHLVPWWWSTDPGTVTVPAGYTTILGVANDGTRFAALYGRVLRAGDGNPTWSWVNNVANRYSSKGFNAVDSLDPIDTSQAYVFSAAGSSIDPGTITTKYGGSMLVYAGFWTSTATMSIAPASYTDVANDSATNPAYWSGDLIQATAGTSASNAGTLSATPARGSVVVALKAAPLKAQFNNYQFVRDSATGDTGILSFTEKIV